MSKIKQRIVGFVENPKYLYILFVFANLMPTFGLLVTEPLDIAGKLVLLLFPLGLYILLFSLSKNIGLVQLLLFPLLFLHAFQIVVFYLFGGDVIAADMFLNVVTTSVSEAGEVLDSILPSVFFVVILYIPTTVFAIMAMRKKVYLDREIRRKFFFVGLGIVLVAYGISFKATNVNTNRFNYFEDVYPVNLLYNLDFAVDRWVISSKYHDTSENFTFEAKKTASTKEREIYVIVVGETSRAENWSVYGYERETTPRLASDSNIVFFRDAITQSNTTHKSVPIILSAASAEDYDVLYNEKSVLEAFKEVGFKTVFLSNQAANRTFTDFFAQEADYYQYFRFFDDPVNNYDDVLVDKMEQCIDSIEGNLFIVLHTYGSHFNYAERYPSEFSKYTPDGVPNISKNHIVEMRNSYDNTILYTDYILDKVIKVLDNTDSNAAMFYTSDHGEDIMDDNRHRFLHASPSPTFYQLRVPFFLWFSDNYNKNYPEKMAQAITNSDMPVATNLAFHTILDIANIETNNSQHRMSVVSDEFKVMDRMYLDDHYKPIPYIKAGLKKQDREMFDKRNMHY